MAEQGRPALEVVLTKLHAGGKFGGDGYKVSGGLHGVGISVVNALSESLVAEVRRDGKVWRQEFARGDPVGDMEIDRRGGDDDTGTTITFLPDAEIFEETRLLAQTLAQRFRETAFLTRGLRIVLVDEREAEERQEFHCEGGIRDFVAHVNEAKDPVHKHIVYFENETRRGPPSRSRCSGTPRTSSRCSRSRTTSTRTRAARTSPASRRRSRGTLNDYARDKGLLKEKEENLEGEDVREGLAAVISVKLREPQFEGQTKTKLGNPWVRGLVEQTVQREARRVPRGEPDRGAAIINKAIAARERAAGGAQGARADAAQERARRRRRCRASWPTARSRDPAAAELFLVEGNSAGGSAIDARDRQFQAILPLRGKIINSRRRGSTRCSRTTRSRR